MYFCLFCSKLCPPCNELKELIDDDEDFKNKNLDIRIFYKGQHDNIFDLYKIKMLPTIIFFNSMHQELYRIEGLNYDKFKTIYFNLKLFNNI